MNREGEESQEDSLKITSDGNFLESWICILISHVLDSWSSCDSELSKCLNSQTWQNGLNNQNHAWAMKIGPKTKKMNLISYDRIFILDHEETSLILFQYAFHEIWLKISFYNPWWKSVSHGVWWKKKFEVWWKNALCFENGVRSLSFLTLKSFHTSRTSRRWKILENSNKILFTLENLKQTLTLGLSSCSLKLKCTNEAHGVKI